MSEHIDLEDLAELARETCDCDAEREFMDNAESVISEEAWRDFEAFALSATADERIAKALSLAESNPATYGGPSGARPIA